MKEIFGIISVIIAFVAYIPYLRDTVRGRTHPHAFSWFVWGFLAIIVFLVQLGSGSGFGAYTTLAGGVISFAVFGLGLRYGKKDITCTDIIFFVLALIATVVWIFTDQPLLAIVLLNYHLYARFFANSTKIMEQAAHRNAHNIPARYTPLHFKYPSAGQLFTYNPTIPRGLGIGRLTF